MLKHAFQGCKIPRETLFGMLEEQHERITGEWKYSDYTPSSISTTAGSETKNTLRE